MTDGVRQPLYLFEGFRLDARRRVLFGVDGKPISLSPRVFDTLLYLVERPGQLVTREKLLEAIWPHVVVEEQNISKTISALRQALGEKPEEHRFIVTKHGRGYRFVAGVSSGENAEAPATAETNGASASAARLEKTRLANGDAPRTLRRGYAIGALIVLVAAVAATLVGVRVFAPNPPSRFRPWSVEKGGQLGAVWSPDGRSTAYAARNSASDVFRIYVRTLDDPVARAVVSVGGTAGFPPVGGSAAVGGAAAVPAQWTTGGKILYWYEPGLWSTSPVGADPVLIATIDFAKHGPRPNKNMHVTRDGSAVAAFGQADDGSVGVWTAKLPEARFEPYEPAPFATQSIINVPFLRFSPDGKKLLMLWNTGRGEEAWLLPFPANARNPPRRVLERLPVPSGTPEFSWLPDNRYIMLSTGTPRALYVADTESGAFRLVASGQTDYMNPVVSPDGDKAVFSDFRRDFDIVTLDLRTAAVTPLIATDRTELAPSWGPSTTALVYVTDRSGEWAIWLHEPPQPDRPLVTVDDFPTATEVFMAPAFSPDGLRVIYQRGEEGGKSSHLWMSSVAGGLPERVTTETVFEFPGSWSPDGAWYVYVAIEGGTTALKKVRTTGQATPETLEPQTRGGASVPVWSPDGAWILLPNAGELRSVDGRATRDLKLAGARCAFAKTEPLLFCLQPTPTDGRYPLVAVDLEGHVVRALGSVAPEHMPDSRFNPGIRLSPTLDGDGITYSVNNLSDSMWLIEGLAAFDLP